MSSLQDPLSKPEWPQVDIEVQNTVLSLLVPVVARGSTNEVKLGFNKCMEVLERHITGTPIVEALFVARSDMHPSEALPLALASTAGNIRLVTLPKGSREKLNGETVLCLCKGSEQTQIINLVKSVGPARLDWVYHAAVLAKRKKGNTKKKPKLRKRN